MLFCLLYVGMHHILCAFYKRHANVLLSSFVYNYSIFTRALENVRLYLYSTALCYTRMQLYVFEGAQISNSAGNYWITQKGSIQN